MGRNYMASSSSWFTLQVSVCARCIRKPFWIAIVLCTHATWALLTRAGSTGSCWGRVTGVDTAAWKNVCVPRKTVFYPHNRLLSMILRWQRRHICFEGKRSPRLVRPSPAWGKAAVSMPDRYFSKPFWKITSKIQWSPRKLSQSFPILTWDGIFAKKKFKYGLQLFPQ